MNDDRQLMQWLGGHRGAVRTGSPDEHPDIETLSKHATGQLAGGSARAVTEHLLVCDDGRCVAFVRAAAEDVDAAAGVLYPQTPNRTEDQGETEGMHQRTFLCRELLWQHFEEMAREMNTPIDQLVEEAMQVYARQRTAGTSDSASAPYPAPPAAYDYSAPESAPDMERTAARPQLARDLHMPPSRAPRETATIEAPALRPQGSPMGARPMNMPLDRMSPPARSAPPPPPPAAMPAPPAMSLRAPTSPPGAPPPMRGGPPMQRPFTQPFGQAIPAPPPPRGGGMSTRPPAIPAPPASSAGMGRRQAPPPLPSSPNMMPEPVGAGALSLTYRGQSYEVDKDHFILGRSKTNADLVLDDSNVSRQHAAIERAGDAWYIVDLGSTNGVYIAGMRVTRQRLEDGDVLEITTHQIFVTLR